MLVIGCVIVRVCWKKRRKSEYWREYRLLYVGKLRPEVATFIWIGRRPLLLANKRMFLDTQWQASGGSHSQIGKAVFCDGHTRVHAPSQLWELGPLLLGTWAEISFWHLDVLKGLSRPRFCAQHPPLQVSGQGLAEGGRRKAIRWMEYGRIHRPKFSKKALTPQSIII